MFVALFVLMLGSYLLTTPQLRVYEDIICRHYYDKIKGEHHVVLTEDIDESLCKIDEIQEELAIVVGGSTVADNVPSLLFALPYGVLGDKIGRKRVFGLALMGIVLSLLYTLVVCWFWRTFLSV
jgi:MFS family permease